MTHLHPTRCGAFAVAMVVWATTVSFSQTVPGTGMLTADAPAFVLPDATRTPLAILPAGTVVVVIRQEGDWYRVRFRDARFGDRTGYIASRSIQLQPAGSAGPSAPPSAGSQGRTARPPIQRTGSRTPTDPTVISFNGGVQTTSRGFESASTIDRFAESGTLNSTYSGGRPMVFDVAVQAGAWRRLGVGIAATQSSKPLGGSLTTKIPHPFFFDRPRTVTGASSALRRKEVALHLDATWTIPATRSTRIAIFGGPSYFKVTQGLVTDVVVEEAYPYDVAAFASATTTETSQKRWGYNAGFDVTQLLSRHFGVGVIGRYSRASFTFPIVGTDEVEIRAGGFQLGGGVRLQF